MFCGASSAPQVSRTVFWLSSARPMAGEGWWVFGVLFRLRCSSPTLLHPFATEANFGSVTFCSSPLCVCVCVYDRPFFSGFFSPTATMGTQSGGMLIRGSFHPAREASLSLSLSRSLSFSLSHTPFVYRFFSCFDTVPPSSFFLFIEPAKAGLASVHVKQYRILIAPLARSARYD